MRDGEKERDAVREKIAPEASREIGVIRYPGKMAPSEYFNVVTIYYLRRVRAVRVTETGL